jgi:hypothetical protein
MSVHVKSVGERRVLHFATLDEVVADAERLVASPQVTTLGTWPLERLLTHLTFAINGSLDGIDQKAPLYIRLFVRPFRNRFLTRTMRAGFKLPKQFEASFFPSSPSVEVALEQLRHAVERSKVQPMIACHPVLGKLSHEQWTQLHLRHAELHLSFAIPEASP